MSVAIQAPAVNLHTCPACVRPHHWLAQECQDHNCPWGHHRGSYGQLVANLGECDCTLEAVGASLVAIVPTSDALKEVLVQVPALGMALMNGEPYQPTADEWRHLMGATVDEQRSMGEHGAAWDRWLANLRDAAFQAASIAEERYWLCRKGA